MKRRVLGFGGWIICGAALALACGGAQPEPASPDTPPPLDDEPAESVAPASSANVQKGIDALTAQDFETAKSVLTQARADNPKDAQAAYYLGVALEGSGDADGAAKNYKDALDLDPALAEAAVNLSAILLDKGDAAGARSAAEAGLKQNPAHVGLLTNRGMALMLAGDNAGAAEALGKASAAAPEDEPLRYSYAETLAASGKMQEASEQLRKLLNAKDLEVLASSARLLGRLKQWKDCVTASENALALQKAPELFVQKGLCHHGQKDEKAAKADFEAAIAADESFAPAHYYLGRHYMETGDKKKAKAALERAVELAGSQGVGKAARKALDDL